MSDDKTSVTDTPVFADVVEAQGFSPFPVMNRDLSWRALTEGALKHQAGEGRRVSTGKDKQP